ncbi:MAG: carboxypeptidase-like regulatory domain-containing protein [Gemmatimonadota bacterium]
MTPGSRRSAARPAPTFELKLCQPRRSRGEWLVVLLSLLVHVALFLPAIITTRGDSERERPVASLTDPGRTVAMVYVPPPPLPEPAPPPERQRNPERQTPPPAEFTPIGKGEAKTPPIEAPPDQTDGTEEPPEPAAPGAARSEAQPAASANANPLAPTTPRETRMPVYRGGDSWAAPGDVSVGPRLGIGKRDARSWRQSLPELAGRCVPEQLTPGDSTHRVGVVVGRVLREDLAAPLAGAHLQIIGTQFATFTDEHGEYRLEFDRSLVDQCRTQYVRVSAPGFRSRLLVLGIGPKVRSDDVALPRN